MTRAALYLRQSLDVSEGIERQRIRCTASAASRGWTVTEAYEDNDTSATKARGAGTAWARMLEDATAGKFDVVVAVDMDRLLRTVRDLVTLIELGVKVVTVDGELDLSTADGEFRATMAAGLARFEGQRKGERQKRANDHRALSGVPMAGKRAFGWKADRVTLDPVEARWLRWMHTEVIAGSSLHSIMRTLNAEGVKTAGGKEWSAAQLRAVLRRERNSGVLVRNGVPQPVSKIEAAVSQEDADLVLSILNGRKAGVRGPKPELNWLSGLTLCGVCGNVLYTKLISGTRYYMCSSRHSRMNPDTRRHVTITADLIESKVLMSLYGHFSGGWLAAPEAEETALRGVQEALVATSEARRVATGALLLPGADLTVISARLAELGAESARLESQRDALVAASAGGADMATLFAAGDSAKTAEAWLAVWNALPVERRRAVIRGAFEIRVAKGKGVKRVSVALA
jgi:site-specific DNA recombinase